MFEISKLTTADFDAVSWHDCHVHGFSLEEREHGTAELSFDIDFIVEWLSHADRPFEFRVAPATLTFHAVFGLRIELDYARVSAATAPFMIDGIERDLLASTGATPAFMWRLPITFPGGLISFESRGFTQVVRSAPLLVPRQCLLAEERRPHVDA
jgi:hypothetical protein